MAKTPLSGSDGLFTRAQYDLLRQHRRRLNDWLAVHDKAVACGIACDFVRTQRDEAEAQLAAIEQHFMTPPPPK